MRSVNFLNKPQSYNHDNMKATFCSIMVTIKNILQIIVRFSVQRFKSLSFLGTSNAKKHMMKLPTLFVLIDICLQFLLVMKIFDFKRDII